MKKILLIILTLISLSFTGCVHDKINQKQSTVNSSIQQNNSSFNNETYIWESWIFPTNKTTGK